MMEKIEGVLTKYINPVGEKIGSNKMLRSIASAFIRLSPVTISLAFFAIFANFPVPAVAEWIQSLGLDTTFSIAVTASTGVIALYLAFSVAYGYSKELGQSSPVTAGFIALASFFIVTPQSITIGEETVGAIPLSYLGSNGIIVALIVGITVGVLYNFLKNKNVVFKLPDSVPHMVSESLGSVFLAAIIFIVFIVIQFAFSKSSFGTFNDFIAQVIAKPLMAIGTSIPAIILFHVLANLSWFLGMHSNTVLGPVRPILFTMFFANIDAYNAGEPLEYIVPVLLFGLINAGPAGNTWGLMLSMVRAKSERYKQLFKIAFVPHIFNINEPVIFGMPLVLNSTFLIPMLVAPVASALTILGYLKVVPYVYNPLVDMALTWTTPVFIKFFFVGGLALGLLVILLLIVNTLIYYPFFKIADNKEYEKQIAEEVVAS